MKRVRIHPYKLGSESARSLATALEETLNYKVLCVKPDGAYRPRYNDLIVNWGNSRAPTWASPTDNILNTYNAVRYAVNKLATFERLSSLRIPTPEWTTEIDVASNWLRNSSIVVERNNLTGTKGSGIRMVMPTDFNSRTPYSLLNINCPLYTKLIKRAREYRVHVFDGQVIDLQQKKRREGNDSDGTIKNLDNGWVFVRDDITPPPRSIFDVAVRSVQALGLDFGGVDIITKDGECYVLEVNCAVGLEGSTINSYVNAIQRYANQ